MNLELDEFPVVLLQLLPLSDRHISHVEFSRGAQKLRKLSRGWGVSDICRINVIFLTKLIYYKIGKAQQMILLQSMQESSDSKAGWLARGALTGTPCNGTGYRIPEVGKQARRASKMQPYRGDDPVR